MIKEILVGIIGTAVGVVIVWKSYPLKNITGQIDWAEAKLGPGGTISLFRLIGVLVILLSLMYMTGLLQTILLSTVGGLFGWGR